MNVHLRNCIRCMSIETQREREREYFMLGLKGLWAAVAGLLRNTSIFRPFFSSVLCFLRAGRLPVGLDIFAGSWKGRKIRKLELSIKVQVCLGADLQLWSIYIIIYIYIYIYVYNITPKRLACPWILPSTSFYLLNCYCRKKYYISWPVKYMIGVVPTWFLWFVLDGG